MRSNAGGRSTSFAFCSKRKRKRDWEGATTQPARISLLLAVHAEGLGEFGVDH
jgi:hypothetical protein